MSHLVRSEQRYLQYLDARSLERRCRDGKYLTLIRTMKMREEPYPALEVSPTVGFIPTMAFLSAGLITILYQHWNCKKLLVSNKSVLTTAICLGP